MAFEVELDGGRAPTDPLSAGVPRPARQSLACSLAKIMLASRVPLQLLLGWVLLLGHPVCGAHEEYQELEPLGEDLEQTGPFGDHQEYLELEQKPLEEPEEALLDSEELLRIEAKKEAQWLEQHGERHPMMGIYKKMALEYYNKQHPGPLYRHLEDADPMIEKAIGTIFSFSMFLVNTNCTKEERMASGGALPFSDVLSYFDSHEDDSPQELKHCVLPPASEQEKLKCWFTVFLDARHVNTAVINHDCQPVDLLEDPASMLEDAGDHV